MLAQVNEAQRVSEKGSRLNERVWATDVQVGKLNEGSKQVARAEDTVARMEKLAGDTTAQLSAATVARCRTISRSRWNVSGWTSCQRLNAQAGEMSRNQTALEALGERLARVDEMGRRVRV